MSRDPRIERLKSDQQTLLALPRQSSYVKSVRSLVSYQPADRYQIEFDLPGILNANFDRHQGFIVTATMGPAYPFREGPTFSVKPVAFHPNIYPSGQICAAAHNQQYVGSFRLIDYIKGIARMIVFTEDKYYLGSTARMDVDGDYVSWWRNWIERHQRQGRLPLIKDFYLLDQQIGPIWRRTSEPDERIVIRRRGSDNRPVTTRQQEQEPPRITIRRRRQE